MSRAAASVQIQHLIVIIDILYTVIFCCSTICKICCFEECKPQKKNQNDKTQTDQNFLIHFWKTKKILLLY